MDKQELETYQVQLEQVEMALGADPSNSELAVLRKELKDLIDLTKAAIAQAEAPKPEVARKNASLSVPTPAWKAGDECLAKYSGDGQWYPARITSVGGSEERRVCSVVFKGYNNTELLNASLLKPLTASYIHQQAIAGTKRKLTKEEEEERERKKKKNEKKVEIRAQKAKEQLSKQMSWQKFTKKAEKKGVNIAGVSGTSIFKSPDNPHGKVGVTGSGKGMTEVIHRGKHVFSPTAVDRD